jgi:lysozyme
MLIGPDVSFYQDDPTNATGINFAKMAANAGYVIIRAGQNTWEDKKFDISWAASKGLIPRGSYWFYDSRIDPKVQANKYISCFADPQDLGELPLWCDFEDTYGGPFGTWRHWYDFIEELKRLAPGKAIGIYTAYYYWVERTPKHLITPAQLEYFKQYPLWIANYGVDAPLVPKPWGTNDWTLWQITDNGDGSLYGVESKNIDLNYFNGDAAGFKAAFGIGVSVPSIPVEETKPITDDLQETTKMTQYSITPMTSGTRMRSDHTVFAGVLKTDLKPTDLIIGDEVWTAAADGLEVKKGDTWMKVLSVNGVPVPVRGWTAIVHKGVPICNNFKVLGDTTPPVDPEPEPTPAYQDVDLRVNIYQGELSVKVNGEEWIKKS